MVEKTGRDRKGLRDRALLLLGFAGAFRRSELVALDISDLQFCDAGLRVTIRKSKTDQEGLGATIAITRGSTACPVDAVRAWIKAAGIGKIILIDGEKLAKLMIQYGVGVRVERTVEIKRIDLDYFEESEE